MRGLRSTWRRGPRVVVGNTDAKGKFTPRLGKHGGPVIEQAVVLCLVPKGARS